MQDLRNSLLQYMSRMDHYYLELDIMHFLSFLVLHDIHLLNLYGIDNMDMLIGYILHLELIHLDLIL